MATGIKKYVILLDADIAEVHEEWLIKHSSDVVAELQPPVKVGRNFRVVPRKRFAMKLVPGETHIYATVNDANARAPGGIYRVTKR